MTESRPTLDQRRASCAWNAIEEIKKTGQEKAKEYAGEAKKMPMRILTAGLGPALAFILAKAKEKKPNLKQLHSDLTKWVIEERPIKANKTGSLLESVIMGDSDFLRRATDETLAYLQWLNRFADAAGLTD
ncbi:MAG: type III-B CRISPR module-associated protein Cmr5 [Thermodesulfobacteriota bacterium]